MNCMIRALGVISLGRPVNRIKLGCAGSSSCVLLRRSVSSMTCRSYPSSPLEQRFHPASKPDANRPSHPLISSHAPSFKKLCTETMLSTCSAGVSLYPFRSRALYICCGEGYSQAPAPSPRGIVDISRWRGRSMTCSSASRILEIFCGIQLRGFNLETYEGVALAGAGASLEEGGT